MEVNKRILLHIILALIGIVLLVFGYFIYDNEILKLIGRILIFFNLFMMELIEYKKKTKKRRKKE